jgi:LPLT family lysophospholipid transporter-like MFS transporter
LMSAGHSIAVQNFNENLSVLAMLCLYAVLVRYDLSVPTIILLFGVFVITTMLLIMRRHRMNMRRSENDPLTLIREVRH